MASWLTHPRVLRIFRAGVRRVEHGEPSAILFVFAGPCGSSVSSVLIEFSHALKVTISQTCGSTNRQLRRLTVTT
eukprot:3099838-Amphidinium_carterae.1